MGRSDYADWNKLAGFLRRKEPPRILGTYENFTVEDARKLHRATFSIGMGAGRRFARQVDLSKRSMILDLGGGSGCYCIAAAEKYPRIKAVVFDLPSVAVVANEYIAQCGFSGRINAVGGDFTKDPFPAGADVVTMASNLPQYSPDIIRADEIGRERDKCSENSVGKAAGSGILCHRAAELVRCGAVERPSASKPGSNFAFANRLVSVRA